MLILGVTDPTGVKRYVCAAFPSACGKTNLAMLTPSLPGWKVETIGDDIAWLRFDDQGRMRAINPEHGFFGVAPGTSYATNPNAMKTFATNSLFTNVGVTDAGDVYWEGMDELSDSPVTDWKGNPNWTPTQKENGKIDTKANPCAHPNSRFTTPLSQCPILDPAWDTPEGVPIDAIIFGGRRDDTQPLVYESFGWEHGTFLGAAMRSNATKAADQKGLVHDPMAMIPFIGYNIKDYFSNWLRMRERGADAAAYGSAVRMPKIFHVNWFGKGEDGQFLWPGFAENMRVLEWILARCGGTASAVDTPIGRIPAPGSLNIAGLENFTEEDLQQLLTVDPALWRAEASAIRKYFTETLMQGDDTPMPAALMQQLEALETRINVA
jgi:phosphoenolpyruvate carboxykinase (GTP)